MTILRRMCGLNASNMKYDYNVGAILQDSLLYQDVKS